MLASEFLHQDWTLYWENQSPEAAEEALHLLYNQVADDRALTAEVLSQIAHAQTLGDRWDAADSSLSMAEEFVNKSHPTRELAWCRRERAFWNFKQGHWARTTEAALQAIEMFGDVGRDLERVTTLRELGRWTQSPHLKEKWWQEALDRLSEASNVDEDARRFWRSRLRTDLAYLYVECGQAARGLEWIRGDLADWLAVDPEGQGAMAALWRRGRVERLLGLLAPAVQTQNEVIERCQRLGVSVGPAMAEMAEIHLLQQEFVKARSAFRTAWKEVEAGRWRPDERLHSLSRLRNFSGRHVSSQAESVAPEDRPSRSRFPHDQA